MDIRRLTPSLSVSPQIEPSDMQRLADAGFRSVIDNRPDAEIERSHGSDRMAEAAAAAGLRFVYLPITPGILTPDMADQFRTASAEGPTLAYCRSGTRSAHLWALSCAGELSRDEILRAGASAGYDLSGLTPYLPE